MSYFDDARAEALLLIRIQFTMLLFFSLLGNRFRTSYCDIKSICFGMHQRALNILLLELIKHDLGLTSWNYSSSREFRSIARKTKTIKREKMSCEAENSNKIKQKQNRNQYFIKV